jgi:hypothetical protein
MTMSKLLVAGLLLACALTLVKRHRLKGVSHA